MQDLADKLVSIRGLRSFSLYEVDELVGLWERLEQEDKRKVSYPPRHNLKLTQGRFMTTKTTVCAGVDRVNGQAIHI